MRKNGKPLLKDIACLKILQKLTEKIVKMGGIDKNI